MIARFLLALLSITSLWQSVAYAATYQGEVDGIAVRISNTHSFALRNKSHKPIEISSRSVRVLYKTGEDYNYGVQLDETAGIVNPQDQWVFFSLIDDQFTKRHRELFEANKIDGYLVELNYGRVKIELTRQEGA